MAALAGSRTLVFALPYWGHLSTCLALADALAAGDARTVFAFVYPPPDWVAREIAAHGHDCHWSLRYVRSALGAADRSTQRRAVVTAEAEIIRAVRPDAVLNDVHLTTPSAARACGAPVVSIVRCPYPGDRWREAWGDVQLAPHSPRWLPLPAPGVVHCRPAWAERRGMTSEAVEPVPVAAALCTADEQPTHLRLVLDAFERLEDEWVLCYPHADPAAAGSSRVVPWADVDALLAGARVLVCHGGHGLIGRAVMRGVPVVVLETDEPHTPIYGAALEAAGAGVLVRRADQSAAAVRDATRRAMEDGALRAGAAALRRSTEALPGIADAFEAALEARACAAS